MSEPTIAVHGRPAATIAATGVLKAGRVLLTVGLLVLGVWTAAPLLAESFRSAIPIPTAPPSAALPTAMASSVTALQSALARARQAGVQVPISLAVSEQDLSRTAAAFFPRTYAGVTLRSPSVRVTSGKIVLDATADSFLGSGPLVATATPYAGDGKLLVRLDSATIAGVALPDSMRTQLAQQLQTVIEGAFTSHLQVTSVTASQGTLALTGVALP